ncbi:MAG: hypothetical protein HYY04_18715 [Chloroflexi bacterium]|nr:hypothetical protein [Chloroflexota bacterium]
MVSFRRVPPEEAAQYAQRKARVDLSSYREFLSSLKSGDWGEVRLDPGEKKPTVKRRLTVAAKEADHDITYKRSDEHHIRFQVA